MQSPVEPESAVVSLEVGKQVGVAPDEPASPRGGDVDVCNVFVKYLPHHFGELQLRELFAPYGTILSVKVMVDPRTGSSLGYG